MGLTDLNGNVFYGPTDLSGNDGLKQCMNYRKEIERLEKENAELKAKVECAEPWIERFKQERDDMEAELEAAVKKNVELKGEINSIKYSSSVQSPLEIENSNLKYKLNNINQKLEIDKENNGRLASLCADLQVKNTNLQNDIKDLKQNHLIEKEELADSCRHQVQSHQSHIDSLTKRISEIEGELNSIKQEYHGFQKGVMLMRAEVNFDE